FFFSNTPVLLLSPSLVFLSVCTIPCQFLLNNAPIQLERLAYPSNRSALCWRYERYYNYLRTRLEFPIFATNLSFRPMFCLLGDIPGQGIGFYIGISFHRLNDPFLVPNSGILDTAEGRPFQTVARGFVYVDRTGVEFGNYALYGGPMVAHHTPGKSVSGIVRYLNGFIQGLEPDDGGHG